MTPELVGMNLKVLHEVVLKREVCAALQEEAQIARTEGGRC